MLTLASRSSERFSEVQSKLFLKSHTMLADTAPAVQLPQTSGTGLAGPCLFPSTWGKMQSRAHVFQEEGLGAKYLLACGKRAARRTEHVSQDIQAQLVTGKELGVMRTEHKANSSTTVSSAQSAKAQREHMGHHRYIRHHMP